MNINPEKKEKIEKVQNLAANYKSIQSYMEDNFEQINPDELKNMRREQEQRRKQIEELSRDIYYSREK